MQRMRIDELIPHPRNNEFFDDLTGDRWEEFKESIRASGGPLVPLLVTEKKVIVSGMQRHRACKELGYEEVDVEVKIYGDNEDEIVKDLIETNVRQRGDVGGSDRQIIARVEALKKYYGVKHGGDNMTKCTIGALGMNQQDENLSTMKRDDILKILGLTRKQYDTAKKIAESAIPEVQELIENGTLPRRAVSDLIAKLSPEDQKKLVDKLPDDVKLTAKTVADHIDQLQAEAANNAANIQKESDALRGTIDKLRRENNTLREGINMSDEAQKKIDELTAENRKFYEKWQQSQGRVEELEDAVDKANKAVNTAEAAMKASDGDAIDFQNQIDSLTKELEAEKRKSQDLEFQLEDEKDKLANLERIKKDGLLRSAISPDENSEEYNQRALTMFQAEIETATGNFIASIKKVSNKTYLFASLPPHVLQAMKLSAEDALTNAKRLMDFIDIYTTDPDDLDDEDEDDDDDYFDELIVQGMPASEFERRQQNL